MFRNEIEGNRKALFFFLNGVQVFVCFQSVELRL